MLKTSFGQKILASLLMTCALGHAGHAMNGDDESSIQVNAPQAAPVAAVAQPQDIALQPLSAEAHATLTHLADKMFVQLEDQSLLEAFHQDFSPLLAEAERAQYAQAFNWLDHVLNAKNGELVLANQGNFRVRNPSLCTLTSSVAMHPSPYNFYAISKKRGDYLYTFAAGRQLAENNTLRKAVRFYVKPLSEEQQAWYINQTKDDSDDLWSRSFLVPHTVEIRNSFSDIIQDLS